ncbi:hypothetical protein E3U55_15510 [Filobacillus milosensis]|uniref:PIN like domain-containing protein n=1 Tax=Filobacillus milosensis TaxID=94137 RepID=A0A4Y8IFE7_9BACI|nr:PIN domain-containing protein [Filobacillus milosensis]TFB13664.1 hypothetical protein E3U55_15510 [Filobacillus milosensis]
MLKNEFIIFNYEKKHFDNLWDDCLFVFDTNVLLNMYRYSENVRDSFFEVYNHLNGRIWIPYHVALEFHSNRKKVIIEQQNIYDQVISAVNTGFEEFEKKFSSKINNKIKFHTTIDISDIQNKYNKFFNKLIDELDSKKENHPNFLEKDPILSKLESLFSNKVGKPYTQEKLNEIFETGEERFRKKIPPGYEDAQDKKDIIQYFNGIEYKKEYGDLIIWNQIIDKSYKENKPIIFVTDDSKKDWWQEDGGRKSPRIELLSEFYYKTNQHVYIYNSNAFLEFADKYYNTDFEEDIFNEVININTNYSYNLLYEIPKSDLIEYLNNEEKIKIKYLFEAVEDSISLDYAIQSLYDELNKKFISPSHDYKVGDKVLHKRFGEGIIMETGNLKNNFQELEVLFFNDNEHRKMISLAPMTKKPSPDFDS